jgi:hypothetical protein
MHERRRSPRVPVAASLEIFDAAGAECLGKGFVTNLSGDGMALETVRPLTMGLALRFRFAIADAEVVDAAGEIVYSKEGIVATAYGIRFSGLSPDATRAITGLLAVRAAR